MKKILTLATIMLALTFFGCNDDRRVIVQQQPRLTGQPVTSIDACVAQGIPYQDCQMQYNAAQDQYFNSVQHYGSMNDCNSYAGGGCYNYHGSWVPAFTGFVAGALIGHSLSNWHYSYHAPYYRRTPPAYVQHTTIVHNYGNSGSTYNTRSNYAAPTTPARPYVSTYGGANAPSSYVNSKYSPSTRTATPAFSAPKTTTSFSAPRTSTSAFSTSRKPTRIH